MHKLSFSDLNVSLVYAMDDIGMYWIDGLSLFGKGKSTEVLSVRYLEALR